MTNAVFDLRAWPAGGIEYLGCCPVCGHAGRKILHSDLADVLFKCAPGKWTLQQCDGCHAAYFDPRPDTSTIHLAYRRYYTHPQSADSSAGAVKGWYRAMSQSLGNGYRNWRYGANLRPASSLGVIAAYLMPGLKTSIDVSYRHLPRNGQGRRLLDVGFGSGGFLETARALGWEVSGVDTDAVSVQSALDRGLDVRQGGIDVFMESAGTFDYVTISHAIEHIHDPVAVVRSAFALLKPGGYLWIDTPNIDSYGYAHFQQHWLGVDAPRHLVIFGWQAIEQTLKKCDFKNLRSVNRSDAALGIYPLSEQLRDEYSAATSRGSLGGFRPRWDASFAALRSRFVDRKRAEFITIIAEKQG